MKDSLIKYYNPKLKLKILRDLIQKEHLTGNKIAEAAYRIRFVRLTNLDIFDDLINTCHLLKEAGMSDSSIFFAELITKNLFSSSEMSIENAKKFLNTQNTTSDKEVTISKQIDTRINSQYVLSCIISIYKEEALIEKCLKRLMQQTLYQEGKLEIIIIDSNSPQNEYKIIERLLTRSNHFLYIKTDVTESLSEAWNRGTTYSIANFLTFTAPSNFFIDDAFERLLKPFFSNSTVVLVQGDIGKSFNEYPADNLKLSISDLQRFTSRKTELFQQLHPFLYGNYLAFDGAVVRKSAFLNEAPFDTKYLCCMENKTLISLLTKGKLIQIGEVIESSFELSKDRLTVHPRVEIEHFMAMSSSFTRENLLLASKFENSLEGKNEDDIFNYILSLSLRYKNPYISMFNLNYYDLNKANYIAKLSLELDPYKFETWNNYSIVSLRLTVTNTLNQLYLAKAFSHKRNSINWFNLFIIKLLLKLVQLTFITVSPYRLRQESPSTLNYNLLRKGLNLIKRIFNRNVTFKPDMFGDVIW